MRKCVKYFLGLVVLGFLMGGSFVAFPDFAFAEEGFEAVVPEGDEGDNEGDENEGDDNENEGENKGEGDGENGENNGDGGDDEKKDEFGYGGNDGGEAGETSDGEWNGGNTKIHEPEIPQGEKRAAVEDVQNEQKVVTYVRANVTEAAVMDEVEEVAEAEIIDAGVDVDDSSENTVVLVQKESETDATARTMAHLATAAAVVAGVGATALYSITKPSSMVIRKVVKKK